MDFQCTKDKLDNTGCGMCLAKWTQTTIYLHNGHTHSCHHPRTHKIPLTEQVVEIDSYNNLLVIGKSDRDMHKTSDWDNPDVPRVTIAFDILPLATVPAFNEINHWIPL